MWKQEMLEQLNKSCEKKYQQEGLSPLTEALELMSAPNKTELKKQLEENKKNIDQQLDKFINTAFKNFGNQTGRYTQIFDRVFIASNKFKLLEKKLRHARRAFQQNNAASAGGNYEEMSQDYSRYTLIETHLVEMIVLIKTKEIIEAMISRGMYLSAARMLTTAVVQVKNQAAVLNANTLPDLFRAMTPMRDFLIKEPSILRGKVMEKVLCYVFRRASFGLVDYIATDKRRKMRQRVLRRARLESETGRQDIRNVNVEKSDNNSIEHDDDTMRLFVWFISLTPIGRRIGLPSPLEYNLSISDLMMASGKTNKQNQQQQQSTKKGSNDKSLNNSDQINQQNNIPQLKVVSNIASLVKNAAAASIIDANAQLPPLTECVAFFSRETQYVATSTLNFVSSTSINVLKDLMEDGPLSVLFDRFNSNIESRRGINSNSSNSDTFESSQFLMMLRTLVHLKLPLEKLTSTLPIAAHIYRLTAECIVMYSSLLAVHGPGSSVNEDDQISQLHTFQQQNKRSASTSARIVNRGPVQQQNNNEAKKLIRSISVDRITTTKFMRKINESQKIKRNETMQKRIMHEKIMRSICSGGKSGLDRSTILISLLLAHFSHALNMLNTTIAAFERIEASSQIKLQQEQPIQHLITSSPSIISNSLSDLDDKSFVHDMNLRTTVLSYAVTTMCHCIKLVCEQAFGNNLKIQLPNIIITDTNIASKAILPAAINFKDNSNQKPYGLSRNSSQAISNLPHYLIQ
ncbi:MAG: hypothetical protein EZS28_004673 [Streblomastix strix]|uniref:Uncharacterized protein n=1 Tax=Streblomastix strix TaxID=222440 RepID=A0A5J4WY92_9EUKA|nr:MAG: hypothetical protein EZS28_004673 [Streblomastix strix]